MKFIVSNMNLTDYLTHCTLNKIEIDLSGANLKNADLFRADLVGANLSGANLFEAYLIRADLRNADLVGTNLVGANLSEANLSGADLRNANLRNANLRGADLRNTNLTNCLGLGSKESEIKFAQELLNKLRSGNYHLDMSSWHTCGTTHCIAGFYDPDNDDPGQKASLALPTLAKYFYSCNEEAMEAIVKVAHSEESVFDYHY